MVPALLLSLLVSGGPQPAPCVIEGTVKLLKDGAAASPEGVVVVYVEKPELAPRASGAKHVIEQVQRQFKPRVEVLVVNETVEFVNQDKELHSVFSTTSGATFEKPASKKGVTGSHTFIKARPVRVQCDRHGWMRTDLLVLNHDYYGVADARGDYRLPPLPGGSYTLVAWEPNGATTKREVKGCQGSLRLEPLELTAAREPKLLRKDGSEYPPDYRNPY